MADTFSNDLRVRLQESGSNAGSWGDLLNGTITNLASALGQGSEAIPNASTHTITLADGTADEARSLYLKCTGGGQACTVTLGPNTISKVWIIDNATSYTLTFSQGSGANVAIAAGAVKVIATDGAGSGAAVVDTLDGLEGSFSSLAVAGALTVDTDTLVVDATNNRVGVGTNSSNGVLHLGSASAVGNTTNPALQVGGTTTYRLGMYTDDEGGYIENKNGDNGLIFRVKTVGEAMRIDGGTGSVGVGTSSPRTLVNASSATGAILTLESSDTSLTTNGVIGGIDFYSNDSSTNGTGAKVNIRAIGQNSSGTATALTFGTSSSGSATAVEAFRVDASGNLLVGTTTAGTKTGDGVIAFGSAGGVMNNFSASVANNGTLDIAINTSGGGYQGFLSVANTLAANAAVRTQSTFSVFGRSTDSTIQQIHTDTGTSGASTFTVTTPSNGVIRVTNTSGSTTVVSMQFFGGISG